MVRRFIRLKNVAIELFKRSSSPKELAKAASLGVLCGLFPVMGLSTLLCLAIGKSLRLNLPIMIAVSYLVLPVQITLVYFFIQTGTALFSSDPPVDYSYFVELMDKDPFTIAGSLGYSLLLGVFSWLLISSVAYLPITHLFRWTAHRVRANTKRY